MTWSFGTRSGDCHALFSYLSAFNAGCFLLGNGFATTSLAQDLNNDPFGTRPGKSEQDPFGEAVSDDNPFGGRRFAANAVGPAERHKDERILALESELKKLRQQHAEVLRENEILKQKCNSLINEKSELEQSVSKKNEMHQRIFEQLLNSQDSAQQQIALQHLMACFDQERVSDNMLSLEVGKPEIFRRLSRLVESDDAKIQIQAARVFTVISRSSTIELGFQFGPTWEPTGRFNTEAESRIYSALKRPVDLDYDEQVLEEIVDEIQSWFDVPVTLSKEVNGRTLVTFKGSGLELDAAFSRMLDKCDLAYRVMDDQIVIMKKTDNRLNKSETYNVRGLLSEKLDIDGLINLITIDVGADNVSVNAVDQHKLVVRGTENDHRRVSRFLGSLAKPAKW